MRVMRRIRRVTTQQHSPKRRTHNSYSRNSTVHPHTEPGRHAMNVLKSLQIPDEPRRILERSVTEMDQELHDYQTQMAKPLSMSEPEIDDIGWTLPPAYRPREYSPQQRRLIAVLLRAKRVVRRPSLYREVTGRDVDVYEDERNQNARTAAIKQMDVMVHACRKALAEARADLLEANLPSYINTVWGVGYKLDVTETYGRRPGKPRIILSRQETRIFDRLCHANGKCVALNDLFRAARFRETVRTPRAYLLQNLIHNIHRVTGREIEPAGSGYKLVM